MENCANEIFIKYFLYIYIGLLYSLLPSIYQSHLKISNVPLSEDNSPSAPLLALGPTLEGKAPLSLTHSELIFALVFSLRCCCFSSLDNLNTEPRKHTYIHEDKNEKHLLNTHACLFTGTSSVY